MRAAALIALLAVAALGQARDPGFDLEIERRGESAFLSLQSDQASLFAILEQLAGRIGARFEVAPEVLETVSAAHVRTRVEGLPMGEAVELLAGAQGLRGSLVAGVLRIGRAPSTPEELASEVIRAGDRTLLVPGAGAEGSFYRAGLVLRHAQAYRQALDRFQAFLAADSGDSRAPRARVLAAGCALDLGESEVAQALVAGIEEEHPHAPEVMQGQLLSARAALTLGDRSGALVRLQRVLQHATDRRSVAIAHLMKTRLYLLEGDGEAATQALLGFDADLQREHPDLAARHPHMLGMCLMAKQDLVGAIPSLQLAVVTEKDPARRSQAALRVAECYLRLDDALTASQAARTASRLAPEGHQRRRALLMEARALDRLGLGSEAVASLEAILVEADDTEPVVKDAMWLLAGILFRERRLDAARRVFGGFAADPELGPWAVFMTARCHSRAGEHERALGLLAGFPDGDHAGVTTADVCRLRGDCYIALGDYPRAALAYGGWEDER